jgi:SAM-dependent methyltransferase
MAAKAWYKDWFNSPYYHKLYFERDEGEARQFIHTLIGHLQPAPGSRMLDVACGRGRHSKLLASLGYDVTGIDLSPDSISYAHQFEHELLHFYQHDMRLPAWINYFDYAFNFFTSFGYFATRREHSDAVSTIVRSLKPGGTLLFDFLNVHFVEERLKHNDEKTIGQTHYEIHRWMDANFFYKKIIVTDPGLEQPFESTEQVAKLTLGDFTELLSFHGVQVTDVFGDYQLNRYDLHGAPRMIIVGRK